MSENKRNNIYEIIDISSAQNRNILYFFMFLSVYILITATNTSHEKIFLDLGVQIPFFKTTASMVLFFPLVSILLFVLQINMFYNLKKHLEKLKNAHNDYKENNSYPYIVNFFYSSSLRMVLVWAIYVLYPFFVFCVIYIAFLPYGSKAIVINEIFTIVFLIISFMFMLWNHKQIFIKNGSVWVFAIGNIILLVVFVYIICATNWCYDNQKINQEIVKPYIKLHLEDVTVKQDTTIRDRDFRYSELGNVKIDKSILSGVGLINSKLYDVKLINSEIAYSNFEYSEIKSSSFKNSTIEESHFENSIIENVDFSGAKIKNVNFSNAKLTDINFRGAKINNTNFCGAKIDNITTDENTTINGGKCTKLLYN